MNPADHVVSFSPHGGTDNRAYARNFSDIHLTTLNEEENTNDNDPKTAKSASTSQSPYNREISTNTTTNGPPTASSTTSFTYPASGRTTALGPNERHLSILDPLSDRVSTVLVWQNLSVEAREDKRKEFFQRMKSYKNFEPKRKALLNSTSGVIAGGLWAVMGTFFFLFYIPTIF